MQGLVDASQVRSVLVHKQKVRTWWGAPSRRTPQQVILSCHGFFSGNERTCFSQSKPTQPNRIEQWKWLEFALSLACLVWDSPCRKECRPWERQVAQYFLGVTSQRDNSTKSEREGQSDTFKLTLHGFGEQCHVPSCHDKRYGSVRYRGFDLIQYTRTLINSRSLPILAIARSHPSTRRRLCA